MAQDKFVVVRNVSSPAAFKSVQMRTSTYEIIKQMQADTGSSFVDLADAMARFCAERLEIVEAE